jgi:hypothetical protein
MREAVARFDNEILTMLTKYSSVCDLSIVFGTAISSELTWSDPSGIQTMALLLENGANGEIGDQVLLLSVERVKSHVNAIATMDLLITKTASPAGSDFRNGLTFEDATRTGAHRQTIR